MISFSFPHSAWERTALHAPRAEPAEVDHSTTIDPTATQSVEIARSHAERGNEDAGLERIMALRDLLGDDEETQMKRGCLTAVGMIVLFLSSLYYSWQEFRYMFGGETAEARITDVREMMDTEASRRRVPKLVIDYTFTDTSTGQPRSETYRVPIDTDVPADKLTVQYLPGVEGVSRPEGQRSTGSLIILGLSIAGLIGFLVVMHREAHAPPTRSGRRPARR